jgi:uncharacterized protein (DUF934 family)
MPDGTKYEARGTRHENLVIRDRTVENDLWEVLGVDPAQDLTSLPPGPIIIPFKLFKARSEELLAREDPIGIWLGPDDEPTELKPYLPRLESRVPLLAVHFPKWGDGRGYSTGTLLRTRVGWRGELRAFGDIGRDHLFQLARVGFDSFKLPPQRDPNDALAGFKDFSNTYQGAVDDPFPLFRRRHATTAEGSR